MSTTNQTVTCADCGAETDHWQYVGDGTRAVRCVPCVEKRHARRVLAGDLAADEALLREVWEALEDFRHVLPVSLWAVVQRLHARVRGEDAPDRRALPNQGGDGCAGAGD